MQTSTDKNPLLCFGKVHHQRLRPVKHAFAYGVYFLRLPLRALSERVMPSRLFSYNRFNLLSFYDKDHGDGRQPLIRWIDTLLRNEGIHDATGEIWLQTFPRVLGYVFNPISFWFCHSIDGALRAVLCEVNNTFGERHYYLLDTGKVIADGEELTARKIFHVSPFCEVKGLYRFRFSKSIYKNESDTQERFNATIDYEDDNDLLLKTGVSGITHELTTFTILKAFLTYPLMTITVITRIHWQALQLWIKRVPFFNKPLPSSSKVTR